MTVALPASAEELQVKPPRVMLLASTKVSAVLEALRVRPAFPLMLMVWIELPSQVSVSLKAPVGVT